MKFDLSIIKMRRNSLGISQSQLAADSGVSLPNIQRIEANSGNPSLKTLKAILAVLDMDLAINIKDTAIDKLAALGVPIQQQNKVFTQRNAPNLIKYVTQVGNEILSGAKPDPRVKDALAATLLAIMLHYPRTFKKIRKNLPLAEKIIKQCAPSRLIKLKRIALANVSQYL